MSLLEHLHIKQLAHGLHGDLGSVNTQELVRDVFADHQLLNCAAFLKQLGRLRKSKIRTLKTEISEYGISRNSVCINDPHNTEMLSSDVWIIVVILYQFRYQISVIEGFRIHTVPRWSRFLIALPSPVLSGPKDSSPAFRIPGNRIIIIELNRIIIYAFNDTMLNTGPTINSMRCREIRFTL
jgi:hypothetical protein